MIYEINGSRIVAPYIGTSTYVWTSLIGVILGALSLGYWLGGRSADRTPSVRMLAAAIFAAAGLISFTILVQEVVLAGISTMPFGLELKSVLAALLLFAPASVALGFVIPYASKLRLLSVEQTGGTVGQLYALSTVGSIVGTFSAGFILIPFLGSVRTMYLIAAALFAVSILLGSLSFDRVKFGVITLFILAIAGSEGSRWLLRTRANLHDLDTRYSRVRVFDISDPRNGRMMRAMATDPLYIQSAKYLDGDDLALDYTRFYHLVERYNPHHRHSLMIGGAGFSFPQAYLRQYPESGLDVAEIDPAMTAIAERFFGLTPDPRLTIFHQDGRIFLNQAPSSHYDAIFMDAFGSLFSVPFQLTTVEAVREMHRVLNYSGVVIFNIGTAIEGPASQFLQAELSTYESVFAEVHTYKVHPETNNGKLQNVIIVACRSSCPEDVALPSGSDIDRLLGHRYIQQVERTVPILTDDHAPVERYASIAHAYR
jgi:spermidine synthase